MDMNPKKFMKLKETEKLKKFEEDTSINSPTKLNSDTNIIQNTENKEIKVSVKKEKYMYKEHYRDKGKVHMFLFDEDGIPKIIIGPHCKN